MVPQERPISPCLCGVVCPLRVDTGMGIVAKGRILIP
jgi:hypothetical protein